MSEKLPEGTTPKATLEVVDNRSKPEVTTNWVNQVRPLITKNDGLRTAYRVPPTGITAHANINVSDKPVQFLYMVK